MCLFANILTSPLNNLSPCHDLFLTKVLAPNNPRSCLTPLKISSQSLGDTQVGYISQKYTFYNYTCVSRKSLNHKNVSPLITTNERMRRRRNALSYSRSVLPE